MRKLSLILGLSVAVASAMAQTRSSFLTLSNTSGISVTSLGNNNYTVNLAGTPTVTYAGHTYNVTDVFGFWALSDGDNLTGSTSDFGVWKSNTSNSGPGGIVGWNTNPNTGITPNHQQSFHFDSLNTASVERFGFHFRVSGDFNNCGSNTFYGTTNNPAPEPASLAALGAGAIALIRRRKK